MYCVFFFFSRGPRFEGGDRPRYGDRDGYRRGGEGEKGGAPADYQPSFQVISHFLSPFICICDCIELLNCVGVFWLYIFCLCFVILSSLVLTFFCCFFFVCVQGSGGRPGFGRGAGGYSAAAPSGSGLP